MPSAITAKPLRTSGWKRNVVGAALGWHYIRKYDYHLSERASLPGSPC